MPEFITGVAPCAPGGLISFTTRRRCGARLASNEATEYLHARPGLTGAWQVSGRTSLRYAERVALDVEYVRGWSIWKDLRILVKTIPAVMHFDNAS